MEALNQAQSFFIASVGEKPLPCGYECQRRAHV